MQKCPNCNKEGLTNMEVIRVGPDKKIECKFCKNEFSVKKSTWLFLLVFFGINVITTFLYESHWDIVILILSFIVLSIVKLKFIKLYNVNDIW